jgi:hypothetical protein
MATHTRIADLMKPGAWLAAVAAVCLVLASSTALYAINSGVGLGLPWWTAVAAPVLVYALLLPLCIPRIRPGGWLAGFFTLGVLHVILGLVTAALYAHVGFTSFEEALAPAFWRFPPALVLEMVGSLLMMLPFMGVLAPRPAAPRIPPDTSSSGYAMSRKVRDLPAPPEKGQQVWARPSRPAAPLVAPAVATIVSTVPPPVVAAAPAIEEPLATAPAPLAVHAAYLPGTNGAPPEIADDTVQAAPDFRQALSELFDHRAAVSGTHVEETPEPLAEPVSEEASSPLTAEAPAWTAPEAATASPGEVARATPEAGELQGPGAVVRIPFDRVVGQLPPGAFRVPLPQVGARLREAETLLVAQALIVPQLGEGVVQVAWEAVAEQFPAAVFAVPATEVKERIVNGRLLLPLDEIVKQLPPDVFGASMGRGPVAVPGIESFPAPFKPLGWQESSPSPVASVAGPLTDDPAPVSIEVPSDAEVAEDLQWTPSPPAAGLEAPADVMEPPRADAESSRASVSDHPAVVDGGGSPADLELDRGLEDEAMPAMATAPPVVEPVPEAAAEPERSDRPAVAELAPVEPAIRISFDRVAAQIPPGAFRVPQPQVSARLRDADTLVVAQALILPQLGEGAVHVAWEAVVEQFPVEVFAMAPADVRDLIEDGRLSLPLDEIVRQLPPDVFGAAMARGPVQVPGIESFPAPFKPRGLEEPAPAVIEPPLPEPVAASVPVEPPIERTMPEPVATSVPVEPAIERTMPEPVATSVPVEPLIERTVPEPVAASVPVEPPIERTVPEPVATTVPVEPLIEWTVSEPVAASVPVEPLIEWTVSEPVAASVPVEPPIERTVREPVAVPQPVPVAPLYEAQAYERPAPFEPPVPSEPPVQPERRDHAERIAALVAPLEAAALDEVRVGDFTIIGVSTAGMAGGAVTAPAARLSAVIARAGLPPIEQVTLRGVGGMLTLTPVGSGWSSGTVLAVGMRSGGALARLEMLARRAAAGHALELPPAPARGGAPFARLVETETPRALAVSAEDLVMLGPLAAQSYREPASGTLVHCLVSPGVASADLAPFAWELAQVMAQSAPAEALGAFHSAVLRSGSVRVEIRRLSSVAGPAPILVVGGTDCGRPGLAHLQVQRTAARLTGV